MLLISTVTESSCKTCYPSWAGFNCIIVIWFSCVTGPSTASPSTHTQHHRPRHGWMERENSELGVRTMCLVGRRFGIKKGLSLERQIQYAPRLPWKVIKPMLFPFRGSHLAQGGRSCGRSLKIQSKTGSPIYLPTATPASGWCEKARGLCSPKEHKANLPSRTWFPISNRAWKGTN